MATHWSERHKVLLAMYLVLRREDGRVLLLRRANTGYMDGRLSMVAGHADGNEPADAALAREAREEAGVVIRQEDLRLVHVMHRLSEEGDHEYVDMYFEARRWQGEPAICEPEKCSELLWADPAHLPDDVIPIVRQALERIAAEEPFSSANF